MLKEQNFKYSLKIPASDFYKIITSEINKGIFKKKHNLSGKISKDGGYKIYNAVSFVNFRPSFGPIVSLHLICYNSNKEGTESRLQIKQINGVTYDIHYWFSIIFIILTLAIVLYQTLFKGADAIQFLMMPLFGIFYHLIIRLIVSVTMDGLISKVEQMLKKDNILFKKHSTIV